MTDDPLRAVDLFCGAGGLSWGLVQALERAALDVDEPTQAVLADRVDLVGVNHWEIAIQTHEQNHPWARHFHDDVQNINPREVFPEDHPDVKVLSGGIECTHWSTARGGKPVDEQKRMPAWDVLTWVQKLQPDVVLLENVKEFERWGPIEDDGTPSRTGETFESWVDSLHALGYSVDWAVLNAADYGDATSRERLFIMARRSGRPEVPEPTHAEAPDPDSDREPWRPAAEIIDWSERGQSIWTRGLEGNGKRPLVDNTMQRIAEGIRRHSADVLEPFADAIAELDADDVAALQERIVPADQAGVVADSLDEPFLAAPRTGGPAGLCAPTLLGQRTSCRPRDATSEPVRTVTAQSRGMGLAQPTPYVLGQHSNSVPRAVDDRPVPTICTGGKVQLLEPTPYVLGQHGGATPRDATRRPVPTVATDGYIRLFDPRPLVLPRNGYHRGLHSNPAYPAGDRPLHTVTAKNHDGWLLQPSLVPFYGERQGQQPRSHGLERPYPTIPASGPQHGLAWPYLVQYHGQSTSRPVTAPTPTLTARDSLALVVPDLYPWGLDVRFRMLQPRELAAAQGFPGDYQFAGNKTETVEQIGNAVPVTLAQRLVESLLENSQPALSDYVDRDPATTPAAGQRADEGGAASDD